jgi:endonuclease/exonuclease/phosphatase family metal-dependent hydrolase
MRNNGQQVKQIQLISTKTVCVCSSLLVIFTFLSGCGGGGTSPDVQSTPKLITAKVLTANIGNADIFNCNDYLYKLCLTSQENILAKNIAALNPDIVLLQEVFDDGICASMDAETHSDRVCYKYNEKQIHEQARRVIGQSYTIACESRSHYECIAIKSGFATISGCPVGHICIQGTGLTHDVPSGCDSKAGLFGIDVDFGSNYIVSVVNAHPQATGESCRAAQLRRIFDGYADVPALALSNRRTIVAGDMNMDPYRDDLTNEDVIAWKEHVGTGKPFYYLSGIAEHNPPYKTSITGSTLDHVISNFATGSCATLGEAPGTTRLDGVTIGTDYYQPETNDHRAILCNLAWSLE